MKILCSILINAQNSCHSIYLYLFQPPSFLQISGDLETLQSALGEGEEEKRFSTSRVLGSGSCSGLVKVLSDHSELFFSHDTWDDYHSMLRIFKLYDLKYSISTSDGELCM